jgi:hypothetical protein
VYEALSGGRGGQIRMIEEGTVRGEKDAQPSRDLRYQCMRPSATSV